MYSVSFPNPITIKTTWMIKTWKTTTKTEQTSKSNDFTLKRALLTFFVSVGYNKVRQLDYTTLVLTFYSFFPIFSFHWAVNYNLMPRGVLKHLMPKRILLLVSIDMQRRRYWLISNSSWPKLKLTCNTYSKHLSCKRNQLNILGLSGYKGLAVVFRFSATLLIA